MLQSMYTAVVADHLITARVDAASRSRHASRGRRIFGRRERAAAPHSRFRVSGASR
jgi:hypothetical protein